MDCKPRRSRGMECATRLTSLPYLHLPVDRLAHLLTALSGWVPWNDELKRSRRGRMHSRSGQKVGRDPACKHRRCGRPEALLAGCSLGSGRGRQGHGVAADELGAKLVEGERRHTRNGHDSLPVGGEGAYCTRRAWLP